MKWNKVILGLVFTVLSGMVSAQGAYIHEKLAKDFKSNAQLYYKVLVILEEQTDLWQINNQMDARSASRQERAVEVVKALQNTAMNTQKAVLSEMKKFNQKNPGQIRFIQQYWIANFMYIEATEEYISALAQSNKIASIEPYDIYLIKPILAVEMKAATSKAVNAAEPGLIAIKAPFMWNLGYTGRGKILYSVDTGTWPSHPAIKDNWLGYRIPMEHAWRAFDSELPMDKKNSHGTHTQGTILGLDPATNDTIGVAFNAYFIAADPIVGVDSNIKSLPELMESYQFALNPDGDPNTTNDIPHVINNSWGITNTGDTTYCTNSIVTMAFDAVEAAGIANIFSAGNDGPGVGTIGDPHHVATNEVNSFCVGALDGNVSTYPIASFSSRGPTKCPATGSLLIKPEVSAPGVNVRSCVGTDDYANYQGTSMAGPHVSGAALLLCEAFPTLTGKQILEGLYYSATDLGAVGEDNIYGMGMINLESAYNYLSQTYTPAPPVSMKYDLKLETGTEAHYHYVTDSIFNPQVVLTNNGDSAILSVNFEYGFTTSTTNTFTWNGNLTAGQSTTINLPQINAPSKLHQEIIIKATLNGSMMEADLLNNQVSERYYIFPKKSLPFFEYFEDTLINKNTWLVENPDAVFTWETFPTQGIKYNQYSARVNNYYYSGSLGQEDFLISPVFEIPDTGKITLKFKVAYQNRLSVLRDSLRIEASVDGMNSFTNIYRDGGSSLSTHPTPTKNFIPQDSSQWREVSIDLSSFAGDKELILRFGNYNRKGNAIYVDNIRIYTGNTEPLSIDRIPAAELKLYPNPAKNSIRLQYKEADYAQVKIQIMDITGRIILNAEQGDSKQGHFDIDCSSYQSGTYLIRYINQHEIRYIKFIKQ